MQIVNSDTYYVLHNGYYVYDGSVKSGWYLQSLVDSSCTPLENISTSDIIVNNNTVSVPISNTRSQESTPRFYPNKTITSVNVGEKHSYNHAFITVNSYLKYINLGFDSYYCWRTTHLYAVGIYGFVPRFLSC